MEVNAENFATRKKLYYIQKEDGECTLMKSHILEMEHDYAFGLSSRFVEICGWTTYDETI